MIFFICQNQIKHHPNTAIGYSSELTYTTGASNTTNYLPIYKHSKSKPNMSRDIKHIDHKEHHNKHEQEGALIVKEIYTTQSHSTRHDDGDKKEVVQSLLRGPPGPQGSKGEKEVSAN